MNVVYNEQFKRKVVAYAKATSVRRAYLHAKEKGYSVCQQTITVWMLRFPDVQPAKIDKIISQTETTHSIKKDKGRRKHEHRSYTKLFKENAIELCEELGVSQTSLKLGIPYRTLQNWHSDSKVKKELDAKLKLKSKAKHKKSKHRKNKKNKPIK